MLLRGAFAQSASQTGCRDLAVLIKKLQVPASLFLGFPQLKFDFLLSLAVLFANISHPCWAPVPAGNILWGLLGADLSPEMQCLVLPVLWFAHTPEQFALTEVLLCVCCSFSDDGGSTRDAWSLQSGHG